MSPLPARRRSQVRFSIPEPMSRELARPQLLAQLANLNIKVAVLLAPSGYGKTALLAQWARQEQGDVIWLKLHQEDRDVHFFLQSLADAFQYFGLNLLHWKSGAILDTSPSRALLALLNDINNHPSDLTLVVDGGEHLSDDSASMLHALIDGLGEGHRVLIAQHGASSFQVASFVAAGSGLEINISQLRFSDTEIESLTRTFETGQLPSNHLQGWPAGIMLGIHARDNEIQASTEDLLLTLTRRLPEDVQQALPALSVVDAWTAATAAVLHLNLPGDWLDQVRRVGLPVTQQGKAFIPHDALREYLQGILHRDDALFRRVHGYAAQQSDREGRPYAATLHFLAAGQVESALNMIQNLIPTWYRTANWKIAIDLLSRVPDESLTAELRSLLALALGENGQGEDAEALALRQVRITPTVTAYYALILRSYRTGNFNRMQEYIDAGYELIRVAPNATSQRDTIQLLRSQAALLSALGKSEEALEIAEKAVDRANTYGDSSLRISSHSVKAHIMQTLNYDSEILLEQYSRLYEAGINENPHRMMPVVQIYSRQLNRMRRSRESLNIIQTYIQSYGDIYPLSRSLLIYDVARAHLSLGDYESSLDGALEGCRVSRNNNHKSQLRSTTFVASWIYFGRGRNKEAQELIKRLDITDDLENSKTTGSLGEIAFFKFMIGDSAGAIAVADRCLSIGEVPETSAVLVSMIAFYELGEVKADLGQKLKKALTVYGEDHALYQSALTVFEPIFRAYQAAQIEENFFSELLLNAHVIGHLERKEVSLSLLGHFHIAVNGEALRLNYSTALEALVYRVLHPTALQDEIALTIWPTPDLARARGSAQQARRTINRTLQTAFKQPAFELLQASGGGRRNPRWTINAEVAVSCDALDLLSSTDAQVVQQLYKGPFLPGSDHDWITEFRTLIARHVAQVYQAQADALGETSDALLWLMRAAVTDQEPDAFERVLALSRILGKQEIERSAQQALAALREGHLPHLTHWMN